MCGNCIFSTLKQNESNKFYNRQKRNSFTARIIAYNRLNVWGLLMVKYGLKISSVNGTKFESKNLKTAQRDLTFIFDVTIFV